MHRGAHRGHLEFRCYQAQLLYGARAAYRTVADKSYRLIVPLRVGVIERILKYRRITVVIFGRHNYKRVSLSYFFCPRDSFGIGHLTAGRTERHWLVKKRHWVIAHIKNFYFKPHLLFCQFGNPCGRLVAKAPGARRTDNNLNVECIHKRPVYQKISASGENRTPARCLGSTSSATKLHSLMPLNPDASVGRPTMASALHSLLLPKNITDDILKIYGKQKRNNLHYADVPLLPGGQGVL